MSNEYMREYTLRRYHKLRAEGIAHLGGVCVWCGTTERLQFDHIDPKTKLFNVRHVSRVKFWSEMEKCQLLCHWCHVEKTKQERKLQ